MKAILDTSVLLGSRPEAGADLVAISTVSLAEIHFGVLVARSADVRAERLRRLSVIERAFFALPVDGAVSRAYGRLAAAVVAGGRQPRRRALDLLVAATAMAHGAQLYTLNAADFAGLEHLVEITDLSRPETSAD